LQQIQGGGGLLILNSQPYHHQQQQQQQQPQQQPQQQQQQQSQQQQQQQQQQVEMQQVTEQQLVPQTSVDREQQTQQEIEAQENMDRSGVQSLPIGGSGSEVTDFAETLDLSQEDIQKTLSANMVPPSPSPSPADNSMINPMDFIDSSDDVLVNLDAFDVFGDLPELHDFEADQTKHEEQRGGPENDVGCHPGTTVHIAEYSPEWSYTEGGVKVSTSISNI